MGTGCRVDSGATVYDYGGKPVACNFEVTVDELARTLPILRRVLVEQSAPSGSSVVRLDNGLALLKF